VANTYDGPEEAVDAGGSGGHGGLYWD